MRNEWKRYKVMDVCPVCSHGGQRGRGSACCYVGPIESPYAVLCLRVQQGSVKEARGGMGFVHKLRDDPNRPRHYVPTPRPVPIVDPSMGAMAERFERNMTTDMLSSLAESLGVSSKSLSRLRVGYTAEHMAFSFPMVAAGNVVVGIRLRNRMGRKWAIPNSRNGLFVGRGMTAHDTLYIVEGPTDTAAGLDLGLSVIGRPSNSAGVEYIVEYALRFIPRRHIVIIHDRDPVGSDAERLTALGADTLATALLAVSDERKMPAAASVSIVTPPVKDLREWRRRGCTKEDVESLLAFKRDLEK